MCSRPGAFRTVQFLKKTALAILFFKGVDLIQYFDIHFSTSFFNYTEMSCIKKG